jgi:putative ABC transport system permease protein
MLKKYIISSLKKILRYNSYSLINILGLAIGLASFILIVLYVYDEYSYDKYHSNSDRIYRITSVLDFDGVGEESASQPFPMGQALKEEYPDLVESYVRFFNLQRSQFLVGNGEKVFNERRFFYCDTSVFEVFDFKLIKGEKKDILKNPFAIVITESTAQKYFDDRDPIGEILKVDNYFEFEVKGVVEDVKDQSHFKFDFLASFESLPYVFKYSKALTGWIWNPCWTYILLNKDAKVEDLEAKLDEFTKKKFGDETENFKLYLQALTDIHLTSHLDYEIEKNENIQYVRILLIIAFLILLIASINFINLATASAANRAKEIGIKKAVGASRRQLIQQFLIESFITTFLSLLIAISLVELFLPAFSSVTGKVVTTDFRFRKETLIGLFSLGIFTGLISGLYPALYLSSFKAVGLLTKKFKLGSKSTNFRKALVLIQFSISLMLIIGTLGVFKQLKYLHNADLGFKKNSTVIIDAGSEEAWRYKEFKESLLKNKEIKNVTGMNYVIGSSHNTHEFIPEGKDEKRFQFYPGIFVREDFVKTFEIQIIAGRDFLPDEKESGEAVLVNEEMVHFLGYEKYDDILGMNFKTSQGLEKVVGVFSNINITSLHSKVEPFVIKSSKNPKARIGDTRYIVIKIDDKKVEESIAAIEKAWDELGIEKPFEYQFLSDIIEAHYSGEEVLGDLARIFTILSIIIAALGIWGLSAYITERRTREVGIRKALGASIFSIVKLINKEFLILILAANIIAWPIAYITLNKWIDGFAYRDYIGAWSFILASMIGFLIAILTVSHKAIEAGSRNPVESLRYE